jgi:two-component system sensor histidine kinase UhpB
MSSLNRPIPVAAPALSAGRPPRVPRVVREILGVPLLWKLAGANGLVLLTAWITAAVGHAANPNRTLPAYVIATLLGSVACNLALVFVALRPLDDLERTARRIRAGDLAARVPASLVADTNITRLGATINLLVDSLTADREKVRRLAAEVIQVADTERARVAHELHDSAAQKLVAISLQLAAAVRESAAPADSDRLTALQRMADEVAEEIRALSLTVHPQVLYDLGLVAALEQMARTARARTSATIELEVAGGDVGPPVPFPIASTLYRVAQEALANALRHGKPHQVRIKLDTGRGRVTLEVRDDGAGFQPATVDSGQMGLGLFAMRERVSLVDGEFQISSAPGRGTIVRASVPHTGGSEQ